MVNLDRTFELFWHPVATAEEVAAARPHPLGVTLLGRHLAVAGGGASYSCFTDRCPHRSTRLSVGWIEDGGIRCAYHGWVFGADGRCVEIPSVPDAPIPTRACLESFEAVPAYGLVWVRLDPSAGTSLPPCPAFDDATMHVVPGSPYTWPTSAPRRVENFVDLAHFAWVHDGTLGRRDDPVPPVPDIRREDGALHFGYDPPDMATAAEALFGESRYCMPMPLTVDIAFILASGARRRLWMTASPIDQDSSRSFWLVARDDDLDGDLDVLDEAHLAFQRIILAEDEPVVCNQDPAAIPLDAGAELSVRTDKVSIEYRRWLRDLAEAAPRGPQAVRTSLFPSLYAGTGS